MNYFRNLKMAKYDETPNDQNYFDSYDNISVHNLMLRDSQRVIKYREAIFASKDLIKDKVIELSTHNIKSMRNKS